MVPIQDHQILFIGLSEIAKHNDLNISDFKWMTTILLIDFVFLLHTINQLTIYLENWGIEW